MNSLTNPYIVAFSSNCIITIVYSPLPPRRIIPLFRVTQDTRESIRKACLITSLINEGLRSLPTRKRCILNEGIARCILVEKMNQLKARFKRNDVRLIIAQILNALTSSISSHIRYRIRTCEHDEDRATPARIGYKKQRWTWFFADFLKLKNEFGISPKCQIFEKFNLDCHFPSK